MIAVMIAIAAVIVVVIVPIAVGVPAMAVLVPPALCVRPAILACLVQLLARVYHLSAVPAVMFCSLMKPMVGFGDPPLAAPFIVGADRRRPGKNKSSRQHRTRKAGL